MRTVDEQASDSFKSSQRTWIRSAIAVGVDGFEAHVEGRIDPAKALGIAKKHSASEATLPETRVSYRITGYDDRPAVLSSWSSYVKRGGQWFVAADDDGEVIGLQTNRDPLAAAEMIATDSEHFTVLGTAAKRGRANEVASIAEEAMTRLDRTVSLDWSRRVPIVIVDSAEEAADLLDTHADTADFVAFVSYRLVRDQGFAADAPRLYVQDANLASNPRESQVGTFVHELMHAATSTQAGPFTPVWLQEGLAEWVRLGKPFAFAQAVGVEAPERSLPTPAAFSASGTEMQDAYRNATSAVATLSARHGPEAPLRLFGATGARSMQPGTPSWNLDEAFRSTFGGSLDSFVDEWRGPTIA